MVAHNKRQALAIVRDPESQTSVPSPSITCTVDLDAYEALGVAFTLRSLLHDGTIPSMAAPAYERVAGQIEAAAKLAMRGGRR